MTSKTVGLVGFTNFRRVLSRRSLTYSDRISFDADGFERDMNSFGIDDKWLINPHWEEEPQMTVPLARNRLIG